MLMMFGTTFALPYIVSVYPATIGYPAYARGKLAMDWRPIQGESIFLIRSAPWKPEMSTG